VNCSAEYTGNWHDSVLYRNTKVFCRGLQFSKLKILNVVRYHVMNKDGKSVVLFVIPISDRLKLQSDYPIIFRIRQSDRY
jgi:hypothetical protein